jgi:hypothetical protein
LFQYDRPDRAVFYCTNRLYSTPLELLKLLII